MYIHQDFIYINHKCYLHNPLNYRQIYSIKFFLATLFTRAYNPHRSILTSRMRLWLLGIRAPFWLIESLGRIISTATLQRSIQRSYFAGRPVTRRCFRLRTVGRLPRSSALTAITTFLSSRRFLTVFFTSSFFDQLAKHSSFRVR